MANERFGPPFPIEIVDFLRDIIASKEHIVPRVGFHLRSQAEKCDLDQLLVELSADSLYIGIVGSRLGGKITLSPRALKRFFRVNGLLTQAYDPALFDRLSADLPKLIEGRPADHLLNISGYFPHCFPLPVAAVVYDIDIVIVPNRHFKQSPHNSPKGMNSGAIFDVWYLTTEEILRPEKYEQSAIFTHSKKLYP